MATLKQEAKQTNKFQWIFFAVIIPILFAITLALVISTVAGINPFQKAQEIGSQLPIISSFVTDPEEEENEKEIAGYEAKINDQEASIANLEAEISAKDEEIENLQEQITRYEQSIKSLEEQSLKEDEAISKLSTSFSEMEATNAADILVDMNHELAVKVLIDMPGDIRGEVLAAMDSEEAAIFSNALYQNN
ncbi:hypothetical protein E3U55_05170 [Filobacillus milosensis]|uniref:Magnesium transporter MgtE intracellular domain-containing protein n=1 Tax=Filobacillus milosensis TaxID=94137 RepID=A0A4Y8IQU6_9BACI|nr:hypothetical protein [Filobacillus milosensis]TFB23211.1 hypothetical protein E3U55_05170 [Filobacillus milosensis]